MIVDEAALANVKFLFEKILKWLNLMLVNLNLQLLICIIMSEKDLPQEESQKNFSMDLQRKKKIDEMTPEEFRELSADEKGQYFVACMVNNLNENMQSSD